MTDSQKLDLLLLKMDAMESKMDAMESKMDAMESKMDAMESKMDAMESKMDAMESRMNIMESRMDALESKIDLIDSKLTDTRLHIENFTDRNIKLLAENHSNLIDKLNQAIPAANKNLTYEVKVNFLVNEVERLKKEVTELKSRIA